MEKAKRLAIWVLVSAPGAVVLQNRDPVQTHFLLITVEMPLILLLLLLLTAGLGFALGLPAAFFFNSSRPKEQKKCAARRRIA